MTIVYTSLSIFCILCTLAFAQSFQAPTNGAYSCVTSQESFLDANAQQVGMLEVSGESYTFTVGNQSERGSIITSSDYDVTDFGAFVAGGSGIGLKSENGNLNAGAFLIDTLGGSYFILQNANGLWIRCDSPGADILAAIRGGQEPSSENSAPTTLSASSTPLNTVVPGTYQCYSKLDRADPADDNDAPEEIHAFQLFDTGEFKDNDTAFSFEETGQYTLEGNSLQFNGADSYYSDKVFEYSDANGTPTLSWYEAEDGEYFDGENWIDGTDTLIITCPRASDVTDASPSLAATEDYNLQQGVKAPAPPPGAGGLSGLFVFTDYETTYVSVMQPTGIPVNQAQLEQVTKSYYFLPDGYVLDGAYEWGYSELDCTSVYKDGTAICGTYVLNGDTITLTSPTGESTTLSFAKSGNDLELDGDLYFYRESVPADFILEGTYSSSYFTGSVSGSRTITFYSDGTFVDENYSTYISVTNTGTESSSTAVVSDCYGSTGGSTTTVAGSGTVSTSSETLQECNNVGRYQTKGYDLVMNFGDGSKARWLLSLERDAQGNIKTIYINGDTFWERQ